MPDLNPSDRPQTYPPDQPQPTPSVRSLKELMDLVSGKSVATEQPQQESGLAEALPFPFLGLVGQTEMKLALLLSVINPLVGGVLLVGPRGTGKTTAVRSLLNLLPDIERSSCFYGCLPEDVEAGGIDAVCPDCSRKYAEGRSLVVKEPVRLVELPLNSRIEDVVGGLDERAVIHDRMRLKRGILAHADQNILYVDEVNLLDDEIVDAILDAAALGTYTVRRGPITASYNARFTLIGSMNPEEGRLRPQILDRFGLRVIVRGLSEAHERLEAYRRTRAYRIQPRQFIQQYNQETLIARDEVTYARGMLRQVEIPPPVAEAGIRLIQKLRIDSLRAEITLFEAARALAAADSRTTVTLDDLRTVSPMALRLRRSPFMEDYFAERKREDAQLYKFLHTLDPRTDSE